MKINAKQPSIKTYTLSHFKIGEVCMGVRDAMKDVLPLKEFVKNITDKGYKVELTKDNVVSDTAVNIYKEVEIKE